MKKILVVGDFFSSGGAETVLRTTIDVLNNDSNYEVDCFIGSNQHVKPKNLFSYLYSRKYARQFKDKLKSFQPDIVHFHSYYHLLSFSVFLVLRALKRELNFSVVYTLHDYHFLYPNPALLKYDGDEPQIVEDFNVFKVLFDKIDHRGFKHSLAKKLQWFLSVKLFKVYNSIDVFISPSKFLAKLHSEVLGIEAIVVRNPIELKTQFPLKIVNPDNIKLVFFGRLSKEKGVYPFVEALVNSSYFSKFRIDIFGTGDEQDKIKSFLINNNVQERVSLKGFLSHSDLMDELPKYDAMVIPSLWYENAPMAIVEATNAGLLVLGSRLGGIEEIATTYSDCILFSPFDNFFDEVYLRIVNKDYLNLKKTSLVTLNHDNYSKSLKQLAY